MVWIQENQSLTGPRPVQSPPKQVCKLLSFLLVWLTPLVNSMTTMLPLSTTIHYPHRAGAPQNTNMPPPAPHAQKSPLVLPSACSLSSSHTSLWEWPDPWASHPLSRLMAFANAVSSNECSLPTVTSSLKPTSSSSSWRVSSSERISRISQSTNIFSAWLSLSQCGVFLHSRYSDLRYLHLTSAFYMTLFWGLWGETSWFCCLQLKHQSPLSAHNCLVHICCMNKWRTWEPECRTFHFPYVYCRPLADKFLVHQYLSLNTVTAKCS